jgi:hypothetical protein
LGFVLRPLLRTRFLLLTLTPACSCVYICKFQFRPIHPPSRRLSTRQGYRLGRKFALYSLGLQGECPSPGGGAKHSPGESASVE